MARLSCAALPLLGCALPAAAAPQILHQVYGEAPFERYGEAVAAAGDVDADGLADWIVGAPASDAGGADSGLARVHSGADGSALREVVGAAGSRLGYSVAGAGDWNGDGFADLVMGAPYDDAGGLDAGRALVVSGADGAVLLELHGGAAGDRLGWSVAGAGDVDGDGLADVIVGAPFAFAGGVGPNAGSAVVYGAGGLLRTITGGAGDLCGWAVAGIGDVDGDGRADLLVGEPYDDTAGLDAGQARVISGADGSVLRVHLGDSAQEYFGRAVAALGLVDGDGVRDYAVAAPYDSAGLHWAGSVRVFSGASGAELLTVTGDAAEQRLGWSVSGTSDLDLDGAGDLILGLPGAGSSQNGRVRVVSGGSGSVLLDWLGSPGAEYGTAVAGLGDVDGNGQADLAVGIPGSDTFSQDRGRVTVYSGSWAVFLMRVACDGAGCPCGNDSPERGCANSTGVGALLLGDGTTSVAADDLRIIGSSLAAGSSALLFRGSSAVAPYPFFDGVRCADGATVVRYAPATANILNGVHYGPGLVAYGAGTFPPAATIVPGSTWTFQLGYRDPAGPCGSGANLSNGLETTFVP